MPSLTVSDEMFQRLAKRADALHVSIEQLIGPLLDLALESQPQPTTGNAALLADWKKNFDAWMAEVERRAHRYPPGFVLDDSRESIYQGCGE